MQITYKMNCVELGQLLKHFEQCEKGFVVELSTRTVIKDYCTKLIDKAVSFEAWSEDNLVGVVNAYFNADTQEAYISNVSVIVSFYGKGIASVLIEQCIKFAEAKQLNSISLEVAITNNIAQMLYKKYGFLVSETKKKYFLMTKKIHKKKGNY
jgi:ribosomal protein S18 acetylase RimI-like enzyme